MSTIPGRFRVQLVVFFGLLVLPLMMWMLQTGDSRIRQAEESYRQGESATTIFARKEAFNRALDNFLKLESEYRPNFGTGKLDFNIGNTYFQLGEYPLAILYYKRAENLMPRSLLVERNLLLARNKIELKPAENHQLLDVLLLRKILSLPERLQVFFALSLLTLLFTSAWFWTGNGWQSKAAATFLFAAGFFLLNLGLTYYFSPVEAVLIHAAEMRRDAGMEFAKVGDQPIPGGSVLEVVGSSPNGKWLKVTVPGGEFGYLPGEALKLVD